MTIFCKVCWTFWSKLTGQNNYISSTTIILQAASASFATKSFFLIKTQLKLSQFFWMTEIFGNTLQDLRTKHLRIGHNSKIPSFIDHVSESDFEFAISQYCVLVINVKSEMVDWLKQSQRSHIKTHLHCHTNLFFTSSLSTLPFIYHRAQSIWTVEGVSCLSRTLTHKLPDFYAQWEVKQLIIDWTTRLFIVLFFLH